MSSIIKQYVQKALNRLGYTISKVSSSSVDAFAIQSHFVNVSEPVIFDIGAHTGAITKTYRDRFPLSYIYSFEPFPQSFKTLTDSVKGDARITCHQTAVSEADGTAVFNSNLNSATNSLLASDDRGASFWGEGFLDTTSKIEVNTTTIDSFCREEGIANIDILKMDVQGAEFSVLKGAGSMLANQKVSLIYSELIMCPTYEGQHKFHEYLSFLDSYGYDFLDFFNPVRSQNQLIQADVVFLSPLLKNKIEKFPNKEQ